MVAKKNDAAPSLVSAVAQKKINANLASGPVVALHAHRF